MYNESFFLWWFQKVGPATDCEDSHGIKVAENIIKVHITLLYLLFLSFGLASQNCTSSSPVQYFNFFTWN